MIPQQMPLAFALSTVIAAASHAQDNRPGAHFDFTGRPPAPLFQRVTPDAAYKAGGFGFDLDSKVRRSKDGDSVTSDRPFFFSVDEPEGNYRVTVNLGDAGEPSETAVKAESRRLMLEGVRTVAGEYTSQRFAVNVRTPRLRSGGSVRLRARDEDALRWDGKLTLEFNGPKPRLRVIEVERADDAATVFLLGDSTVADRPSEPWNSWGQMLPRFFGPDAAVANHAESGESLRSSAAARRLEKVYESMKPGDFLLVQFGHNDMKERGEGVGAFTTYKADLRRVVDEARRRGGQPVLVTPVNRRTFDAEGKVTNSLGDYPEAVRQVAREAGVPLIDLHVMSKTLYEALGPAKVGPAFVDGTHHTNYGAYEMARCVVEGIRLAVPDLAQLLRAEVQPFDPARPDRPEDVHVPPSPGRDPAKPEGN